MFAADTAAAQDLFPPLVVTPTVPNFAGLAFGSAPSYIGSDDTISGPVPVLRLQQEDSIRAAFLLGTVFSANILNHPVLRTGPTGVYRLGRTDVDDDVVARLPEVDPSIDLGWTLGAEFIDPENIARRVRADVNFRSDVTGTRQGYVVGASASAWTPTPFFLLGAFASVTWGSDNYMDTYFGISRSGAAASGLPVFHADAGVRDVAGGLVAMVPLSDRLVAGAGVIYSELLNDAADSPIVADRGDSGQLIYGVGLAYGF